MTDSTKFVSIVKKLPPELKDKVFQICINDCSIGDLLELIDDNTLRPFLKQRFQSIIIHDY